MEQEVQNVETETTIVEETKNNSEEVVEKTFTQKDVDGIVEERLNKYKKKFPELEKYNKWVEEQKTEDERKAEKEAENIKVVNERNEYAKENKAFRKGVNPEDVDYVIFKVSKMEGDFDDNLESFLNENPKYLKKQEMKATGVETKSSSIAKDDGVLAILKAKHPDIEF